MQLLQPRRVVSTTPICRAVELDYVKNHCMGAKVSSDDPIWKLLDINMEAGISFRQAPPISSVSIEDFSFNVEDSAIHDGETDHLQQRNPSTNCSELRLILSPSRKTPPLTLFGRARLGFQDFNLLQEEEKRVSAEFKPLSIVANERGQESLLEEVGFVEVQCEKIEANEVEVGNKGSHSNIGSSDCLDASLRRLYRSMNVPVPRPLPSLVELRNASKRAKRRIELLSNPI